MEALEAPLDSPAASVGVSSFETNKRQYGKLCPHCKEGFLIQMNNESYKSNSSPQAKIPNGIVTGFKGPPEEELLSPGHIDISTFSSYPDTPSANEHRYRSRSPRLSPIPPSPFPDMTPFETPVKSKEQTNNNSSNETSKIETDPQIDAVVARTTLSALMRDTSVALEDDSQLYGQSLNSIEPSMIYSNSLMEEESSLSSSYSENKVKRSIVTSSNPFDELDDDEKSTTNGQVSKSLSATHTVVSSSDMMEEKATNPKSLSTGKPMKDMSTDQGISESVPGESKFKSYFSTLMGSGKGKRPEEETVVKRKGHTRSKSQDFYRVKPLPDAVKDRSIHRPVAQQNNGPSTSGRSSRTELADHSQGGSGFGGREGKSSGSGSGSGGGAKRFGKFSVTISRKSRKNPPGSSSETEESKSLVSSLAIPYKEDDPTYLHNNFMLYLSMEVFTKSEQFELAIKVFIRAIN